MQFQLVPTEHPDYMDLDKILSAANASVALEKYFELCVSHARVSTPLKERVIALTKEAERMGVI